MKSRGSYKTEVVEQLFHRRWKEATKTLTNPVVSLEEVQNGIREYNATHSTKWSDRNPANFSQDLWRKHSTANRNWPDSVLQRGYVGRGLKGGDSFEFIPIDEGQIQAVDIALVPKYDENTRRFQIESVSLPLASKRLGRTDEPWLIQVLIKLRVIETHLALSSKRHIIQLDHLQTNVKLGRAEIDALFLAITELPGGGNDEAIVCCEAKGRNDDIVPNQILNAIKTAFAKGIEQDVIIPIAVKAIAASEVFLIEYEPVKRDEVSHLRNLKESTAAIYVLVPPVPGIGELRVKRVPAVHAKSD